MTRRTRLTLATAGLVAMTAAFGAALPATATPIGDQPGGASVKSECEPLDWGGVMRSVHAALESSFVEKMALTSYEGTAEGSAVTDVNCLTQWTFRWANQRDRKAMGARVTLDLTDGGKPEVRSAPAETTGTATAANLEDTVGYLQKRGYRQPFYAAGKSAYGEEAEASTYIQTTDREYVRLIKNGSKVIHTAFPDVDLPFSVTVVPATFFRTGGTKDLPSFDCPIDRPYLWNADLDSGVKGAAVRRTWDEGTLNSPNLYTVDGLVAGWDETTDGLTTGTPERGEAFVYALCTDDRTLGYAPTAAE